MPSSNDLFLQQMDALCREGLDVSIEYQNISNEYKRIIIEKDTDKLEGIIKKHQLIVEAFTLVDQQIQIILKQYAINNLKDLSIKIESSNSVSLVKNWSSFKKSIQKNQTLNSELDLLLEKNHQSNQTILNILQGINNRTDNASYDQTGQVNKTNHSRSFGRI